MTPPPSPPPFDRDRHGERVAVFLLARLGWSVALLLMIGVGHWRSVETVEAIGEGLERCVIRSALQDPGITPPPLPD